jgi:hypothetical protein
MKKNQSLLGLIIVSVLLFSSCAATHSGYMSSSASLSSANFKYVEKGLKGEATATYVFGFGGLAKATLVDAAKQKMLKSYPLQSNQALSNLTVNFKNSFYAGLFTTVTCIVTSDVVEFK